jgi:peptide/nickel transport system substrate-binding protein
MLISACAGTAAERGGTIVFASGADLQSINPLLTVHPLARQVQRYALLTTLLQRDSALEVRPYLARRWEWSADSMHLTLHVAQDVRWHDGVATTAGDAAWTINAGRDPATGYPRISDLADVTDAVAADDSTLTISFAHTQARLPDVLTDLAILPAHLLDSIPHDRLRGAAWNQAPTGNGPFRFVSHQPNRRWVFDANRDFSATLGGPPHIDRLVIAVVDEPTTKLAALTSGELDFAGISPAHVAFVRRDPRLAVLRYPLLFTYAIVLNTRRPPFDDIRVRQAINVAIDRNAMVHGYLFGLATPATGPLLSDTGTGSPPDLAQARALLAGRAIHFELLTVGSGEAALEQMIQSQLAAVGITVTIRQLELSTYLDRVQGSSPDFQAAVMGVAGDLEQGELAPLLATAGELPPPDREAQRRRFTDSMPAVFLYHAGGVQGMNRRVRGVQMDLRGELATLHDWRVAP